MQTDINEKDAELQRLNTMVLQLQDQLKKAQGEVVKRPAPVEVPHQV